MFLKTFPHSLYEGGADECVVTHISWLVVHLQFKTQKVNHSETSCATNEETVIHQENLWVANLLPGVAGPAAITTNVDFALLGDTNNTRHFFTLACSILGRTPPPLFRAAPGLPSYCVNRNHLLKE